MKIAVNTRLLLKDRLEGIGWFTYETLKRITKWHPEHQFYFIFDRVFSDEFVFETNVTPLIGYPQARHPYLWYFFFEYGIPYHLNKIKPDLFLSPDGWLSLRTDVKSVNVIHDLNFEHHPEFIKPNVQKYYNRYFHQFAQKATRIATVSEFTKNDIHSLYQISLDNIDVVYNGCNLNFGPLSIEDQQQIKEQYTSGCDYFLFIGLIHKRKNLVNIFRAFDLFKTQSNSQVKLLIVGSKKWWQGEIEDTYLQMQYKDDVIFMGHISSEELSQVTASAIALIYTSLFEGFGIPILEAFYAETAVITSNITSMPEVAGEAAILTNPYSVEEIAQSLLLLYHNPKERERLISKGRQQREKFNWDKTAKKLWQTIEKA
ncbi:MAG: glycosyltransferase family 1 protein [Bacteroidales bacterium]